MKGGLQGFHCMLFSMYVPYSGRVLQCLKFTIFMIWPNLQNFHFVKCSFPKRAKANRILTMKSLILNEILKISFAQF